MTMDASVAKLVDVYADNIVARDQTASSYATQPDEVDVDALFDELENEDDGSLRERRLEQLQKECEPPHTFPLLRLQRHLSDNELGLARSMV